MTNHLQPVQHVATLIELRVPGLEPQRIQNWCRDPYLYQGHEYFYSNFDGAPIATRAIDFTSVDARVTLGNRTSKEDALRPTREWLRQYDGWRRARVTVIRLDPFDTAAPPFVTRLQVLASELGATVELELRSPLNAVNGFFPTVHITSDLIPNIPYTVPSHRF